MVLTRIVTHEEKTDSQTLQAYYLMWLLGQGIAAANKEVNIYSTYVA